MASERQSENFGTSSLLDINKLNEVLEMLKFCKFPDDKWFQFGVQLRLSHATLRAIETDHKGVDRCLLECMSKWLSKADDDVGPLTWEMLARALFGISENAVADEILKIVTNPARQLLQHYSSRLSLPEESVQLLFTEGVVSSETSAELKSRHGLLVGGPLRALHTTVAEDHKKLRVFATVLLRFDQTRALARKLLDDYVRTFSSEVHTSPESSPTPTADTSTGTVAAVDSGDHTASTDTAQSVVVVNLYRDDQAKFDHMRTKLGRLLHNVAPLIKDKIPSVEDLKVFMKRCRPELNPQLAVSVTFDEVMEVILEKCSVINIDLLEGVVDQYAIEAANDLISAYKKALDEFCNEENSLRICNSRQLKSFSSSHLICETIKFILNWEIDKRTLSDIEDLQSKAFRKLARRVEVVVIKEYNSITVICYAPHYLMESLLLIARENLDLLKEMGLMSLTIGYYTVYDQGARDKEILQLEEDNKLLTEQLAQFKTEKDEHDIDLLKKLQTQEMLVTQKTRENEGLKVALSELKEHIKEKDDGKQYGDVSGLKQIPSDFNQILQSIGVFSEATNNLSIPDDISYETNVVSHQSLKSIIFKPEIKIKVRRVLVLFTGLPKSGKSNAFNSFVGRHVQSNPLLPLQMEYRPHAPNDISHYDLVAAADFKSLQSFQLTKATKESSCIFGILSVLQQQLLEEKMVPLLDSVDDVKCFENPQLNEHIQHIYQYLQSVLLKDSTANFANGLMSIPDEYALVNMWDVPSNNIMHHILLQLQGHLTKNYLCQFLNLDRDLENLQRPPEMERGGDRSIIMKWRPRLHYLLRSCRLSDSQVQQRKNVVTIFAEYYETFSHRGLKSKVEKLKEIVQTAAVHTGVSELLNDRIEIIDVSGKLGPLSQNIKEVVFKTQVEEIPIAWLFLRSFLHYSDERFITKKALATLAEECGMDHQSLKDFCKFYMSFGSIFDFSLVDCRSKYVIIKPIHFLRSLRNFLRLASDEMHRRFPTIRLGIVPEKAGSTVFIDDWPAYEDALVCLKLATEVEINQLDLSAGSNIDPDSKCYYIPLSHTGQLMANPDPHSIHLITSINTPDVFKEVTLVEKLLKLLPQSKLVPCHNSNQIVIKDHSTGTTVTFVSYGPAVKIHLDRPNDAVCEAIVQVYDEIARNSDVTVKYMFVKMCIEGDIPNARYLPSAPYHILPTSYSTGTGLCDKCEGEHDHELLKVWNEALHKYPIQEISRPSGQLQPGEKTSIANQIAALNIDVIAKTFDSPDYREKPELKGMSGADLIYKLFTLWERKIQETKGAQEPRRAFARKITELWDNFLHQLGEVPKGWKRKDFVELANSVDLYYIVDL